jgi:hypothetical protein
MTGEQTGMELDGIGRGIQVYGVLSKHLPAGHQENYENLRTARDWNKIPNRHLSDSHPEGYSYTKHFGFTSLCSTASTRTWQK